MTLDNVFETPLPKISEQDIHVFDNFQTVHEGVADLYTDLGKILENQSFFLRIINDIRLWKSPRGAGFDTVYEFNKVLHSFYKLMEIAQERKRAEGATAVSDLPVVQEELFKNLGYTLSKRGRLDPASEKVRYAIEDTTVQMQNENPLLYERISRIVDSSNKLEDFQKKAAMDAIVFAYHIMYEQGRALQEKTAPAAPK